MPKLAQKFTDIVIVGQGTTVELIKRILSYQPKRTFAHFSSKKPRFISENTLVVDGEKVSGKKFLIVLPRKQKTKSYTVVGDHPLPSSPEAEQVSAPQKPTCIVGDGHYAVEQSIQHVSAGARTLLLSERSSLLPNFDMAVQDVIEKLLKKKSVEIVKNTAILSLEPTKNTVHIVGDTLGSPFRLTTEQLIISPEDVHLSDIGLQNIQEDIESAIDPPISTVGDNVVIIKDSPDLGLTSLYKVSEFLLGKKGAYLDFTPRSIYRSPELCYFSIGILEQDYFDTHLSYKKSIAKISGPEKSIARWFIKVLASTHNKIIGIHAVLPFDYQNIDLLINLVENGCDIDELRSSCLVSDELAEAFIEIIGELA